MHTSVWAMIISGIEEDMVLMGFSVVVAVATWFNQMINAISLVCIWVEKWFVHGKFHNAFQIMHIEQKWRKMPLFSSYCINCKVRFDVIYDHSQPRD